jgi:hypothetical protein
MRMARLWAIDTRNLYMVSGGLTAVIINLVISFFNVGYTAKDEHSDNGLLLPDRLVERQRIHHKRHSRIFRGSSDRKSG